MKKYILIIFLISLFSCKSKKIAGTSLLDHKYLAIEIINSKDDIKFNIKNLSNNNLYIKTTKNLDIEKWDNEKWIPLRILDYPCDAPGARPSEYLAIASGNIITKKWDKKESWCGKQTIHGIRKTEEKFVDKGRFRIRIIYGSHMNTTQNAYKEFEIK